MDEQPTRWRWWVPLAVALIFLVSGFIFTLANNHERHIMTPTEEASYIAYRCDHGPDPRLPRSTNLPIVDCNGS